MCAESTMYAEGLRLAVLTSFIRLLELRLDELEDVQKGTGSLDSDISLLKVCPASAPRACALPDHARMLEGLHSSAAACCVKLALRAG